jgi:DNA-binding transcriptional ArsR family regulator
LRNGLVTFIFVTNQLHMRRDVFQAIADPTRREIIHLLSSKTLNLNAVAENFNVSRPAISRHIKILTQCGLIVIRQQGRERYCEADLKSLNQIAKWVDQYRVFWTKKLDALEIFLASDSTSVKPSTDKKKTKTKKH